MKCKLRNDLKSIKLKKNAKPLISSCADFVYENFKHVLLIRKFCIENVQILEIIKFDVLSKIYSYLNNFLHSVINQ